MAVQIPRDLADILEDNISAQLRATAAEQAAINPNLSFNVFTGRTIKLIPEEMPGINVYIENIDPQAQGAKNTYIVDRVSFNLDLYAEGRDQVTPPGGGSPGDADSDAGKRLLYLANQARRSITEMKFANMGLGAGVIGKSGFGTFNRFLDGDDGAEEKITGGRLTFWVEVPYFPLDQEWPALEAVGISGALYSANYNYT